MSSDPLEDEIYIYDQKLKRYLPDPTSKGWPQYPIGFKKALIRRDDRLGEVVYPIADRSHELRLKTEAVARVIETNPDSDDPAIETMFQQINEDAKWLAEESRSLVEEKRHLFELFPGNPVKLILIAEELTAEDGTVLPPNRLLLDVTDATLPQVREFWSVVYWRQKILKQEGKSQKRMPGRPLGPATDDTKHWVGLSRSIGEGNALSRFRKSLGRWQGNWIEGYQWWWRNVRRHLKNSPNFKG